jgi:Family of unknown function (DUF6585)
MTIDIPTTPSTEAPDLGNLIDVYKGNSFQQLLYGVVGLTLALFGCILMVGAANIFPNHLGFRIAEIMLGALLVLVGGLLLCTGVFYVGRLRALVYEQGLVLKNGRSVQTFRWEELQPVQLMEATHLRNGQISHYTHTFRIRTWDGREAVLEATDYSRGEDLGRTIMREVQGHALKKLLKSALKPEAAEEWNLAWAAFEKLLSESPCDETAEQANMHIQEIREHLQ